MKAKPMMGAIRKESPPEHWDNSMTTRTLLIVLSSILYKTLDVISKRPLLPNIGVRCKF